jgi:3-oxoacyl-[acyl-carrier-protein] synthase II
MNKVFVTGIGLVTPIGMGREAFWRGLVEGRSGAGKIGAFDADSYPVRIACEVDDFAAQDYIPSREAARMDRFTQMAVAAAGMALEDSGIEAGQAPRSTGVIVGSGIGGLATIEEQHSALLTGGLAGSVPLWSRD